MIDLAAAADDAAQEATDSETRQPASDDECFEEPVADAAATAATMAAVHTSSMLDHSDSSELDEAEPMQEELVDGLPGV